MDQPTISEYHGKVVSRSVETLATIVAALLGGVIGSLGAQWLGERYRQNQAIEATRRDVAVRHLVQLQDALESLWFRIDNLAFRDGRQVMQSDYYELSTIYVIGYALAQKRLLTVEGAYAKLDVFQPGFARELEGDLEALERALGDSTTVTTSFYRYERRALADFLLAWDGVWRVLSYTEFATASHRDDAEAVIAPARGFLSRLDTQQASAVLQATARALQTLESTTGIHVADAIIKEGAASGGMR
jgi:hypothetical protein